MIRHLLVIIISYFFINCESKREINIDLSNKTVIPKTYVVNKTSNTITIDGKDNEIDWINTSYSEYFIDIEGVKSPLQKTRIKMLWDKKYLYIFAKLEEQHIWADITKKDAVIFKNNDFEVFISPSNDTHNYGEIEINALGTVWDLLLNKPYKLGGKAKNEWDLKYLKTGIYVEGTLNNPNDLDKFWSIELAIPLQPFIQLKNTPKEIPVNNEQWRINFSRVNWDFELINKKYSRKKQDGKLLPEYNWVWSNQGVIDMHVPENWGYIQFSTNNSNSKTKFTHQTDYLTEQVIHALFREISFKNFKKLKETKIGTEVNINALHSPKKTVKVNFLKTYTGFNLKTNNINGVVYSISENGLLNRLK
ncbi:MAG: carbohydrate-binding family 9-like protein [Bacteroidetes bacterium]|nr:carbohydrate-binding family 9-like protein [Bacteroidota bacterium]MDA1019566.1 carbohydrate-binding family 9-like protein [Bacteroidota bacterium]